MTAATRSSSTRASIYSTYLGGSGDDRGYGIAVDGAGSAYVTGTTCSTDFPTTAGAFDTTFNGGTDAFVTKLDASGAALVYSTYLGGSGYDEGLGIAVDAAGNAYVTGLDRLGRLPDDRGRLRHDLQRRTCDAFVTKLDASGAALVYSTYLGGSGGERGDGIAVDGAGNAYVTGDTGSADFPTTAGAFDTTYNGERRRLRDEAERDRRRPRLLHLPGRQRPADDGHGIAVDGAGSAYVTGVHRLDRLPDDRRAPSTRPTTAAPTTPS